MVELTLPYPPTVNHYKRAGRTIRTRRGKIFQSRVDTDETKRFYYEVWMKIKVAMGQEGLKSFAGATIYVELDVFPPDKRKRDLDNLVKPTLDALQKAGLFDDDNQIAKLLVTRKEVFVGGQIIVRINEL